MPPQRRRTGRDITPAPDRIATLCRIVFLADASIFVIAALLNFDVEIPLGFATREDVK